MKGRSVFWLAMSLSVEYPRALDATRTGVVLRNGHKISNPDWSCSGNLNPLFEAPVKQLPVPSASSKDRSEYRVGEGVWKVPLGVGIGEEIYCGYEKGVFPKAWEVEMPM